MPPPEGEATSSPAPCRQHSKRTSSFPSRSSSRTNRAVAAASPSPTWPARRRILFPRHRGDELYDHAADGDHPVGLKDFTPIANFAFDEYMLMVKADSKYKSMKDIVADAMANPKKITVGGTQLGSSDSICAYLIEKAAGIQLQLHRLQQRRRGQRGRPGRSRGHGGQQPPERRWSSTSRARSGYSASSLRSAWPAPRMSPP